MAGARICSSGFNMAQFGRADRRVFRGIVAKPGLPDCGPRNTKHTKEYEYGTPVQTLCKERNHQRGHAATQMGTHEEDTLRSPALARWEPARKPFGDCRPRSCLTSAKKEPEGRKRPKSNG